MRDLSVIWYKKIIPGNIVNRKGIINDLSLISVLLFVFLIPWGQSISVSLPANVGLISFALTIAAIIIGRTHKKFTIYHFFVLVFWLGSPQIEVEFQEHQEHTY